MLVGHGSGIDELLTVAVPVAVVGRLLVIADRRARRAQDDADAQGSTGTEDDLS